MAKAQKKCGLCGKSFKSLSGIYMHLMRGHADEDWQKEYERHGGQVHMDASTARNNWKKSVGKGGKKKRKPKGPHKSWAERIALVNETDKLMFTSGFSVNKATQMLNFSNDSYRRWKDSIEKHGADALMARDGSNLMVSAPLPSPNGLPTIDMGVGASLPSMMTPAPEVETVDICFCPHCGKRLPNAIVE